MWQKYLAAWFLFVFAQLKKNMANCYESWESSESDFPISTNQTLDSYIVSFCVEGALHSFLKSSVFFVFSVFTFLSSPPSVPSHSTLGQLALHHQVREEESATMQLYSFKDTTTSFWRWFLVLPQPILVFLNPWSVYIRVIGEPVKFILN